MNENTNMEQNVQEQTTEQEKISVLKRVGGFAKKVAKPVALIVAGAALGVGGTALADRRKSDGGEIPEVAPDETYMSIK